MLLSWYPGKLTVYLGRRDFVDNTSSTDPIDGVVVCDDHYLQDRKIFASVTVTYRFGREEDEVMGLSFSKEMQLICQQVHPSLVSAAPNDVQQRLMNKIGGDAHPFNLHLPEEAPVSVQLSSGSQHTAKPLGVIYELQVYVAKDSTEIPHRRSAVSLAVRKVQYCPLDSPCRQPSAVVSKGFVFSSGKINLEVSLDKDVYYHDEPLSADLTINNNSKKSVKNIKCAVVQHIEVTMTNNHFNREVASVESKEGCPIGHKGMVKKNMTLTPQACNNKVKAGIALDGKVKDADANLASSTLVGTGKDPNDALGIIVSYSFRVRLNCGALGGELVADLPFKLMHPVSVPGESRPQNAKEDKKIEIEEFASFRRGFSVDQH
ncbi:Arrestin-like protein [Penaeus vannamei]|uniref:Arrestin-like protein n=1 Tax=Penaeus vannamei TaxID=6689 RepID=A0A423U9A8_PENVA|nr:Arrestin-like protein [Penaeus vannamei]